MSNENSFAVIRTGGKQYRVIQGQRIGCEKLIGEVGSKVEFNEVLLLNQAGSTQVGNPIVTGCKVLGTIVAHERDAKVITYKKRRRKGYTKKQGHRQATTKVLIDSIA